MSLLRSSLLSFVGAAVSRGAMLIVWFYCAYRLLPSENAELGYLRNTINMLVALTGGSIGLYVTKEVAKWDLLPEGKIKSLLHASVFYTMVALILLLIFDTFFPLRIENSQINESYYSCIFYLMPVLILSQIVNAILSGTNSWYLLAKVNIAAAMIGSSSVAVSAYFGRLDLIILFYFIYLVVQFLFLVWALFLGKNNVLQSFFCLSGLKASACELKEMLLYAFPAYLTAIFGIPFRWYLEKEMIGVHGPNTEVSVYYIGMLITSMFMMAMFSISMPIYTKISRMKNCMSLSAINFKINLDVGAVLLIPLAIATPTGISHLKEEYGTESSMLILITAYVCLLLTLFKQGVGRVVSASGKTKYFLVDNLLCVLVWGGALFVFGLEWNVFLIGMVAGNLIGMLAFLWAVKLGLGYGLTFIDYFKMVVYIILMCCLYYWASFFKEFYIMLYGLSFILFMLGCVLVGFTYKKKIDLL